MLKIDRYELEDEIGKGGMGVVYRAFDPLMHRTVALKTISTERSLSANQSRELRERFLREARAAGGLSHPNIVMVHDCGDENGTTWIVMEHISGKNLENLMEDGELQPERAMSILAQIAAALDFAHARGVIHRDVKPSNVLIGNDGSVKLTDFGIARTLGDTRLTRTNVAVGTPQFMAPEQIRAEEPDSKTDQFALGVLAYRLATGEYPFRALDTVALIHQILEEKPVPPVTGGLGRCLLKALAKDRRARFESCQNFARELSKCWQEQLVGSRPSIPSSPARGISSRLQLFSIRPPEMLACLALGVLWWPIRDIFFKLGLWAYWADFPREHFFNQFDDIRFAHAFAMTLIAACQIPAFSVLYSPLRWRSLIGVSGGLLAASVAALQLSETVITTRFEWAVSSFLAALLETVSAVIALGILSAPSLRKWPQGEINNEIRLLMAMVLMGWVLFITTGPDIDSVEHGLGVGMAGWSAFCLLMLRRPSLFLESKTATTVAHEKPRLTP